ncbi:MAG: hypothetical protein ABEI52_08475, partial [Halobacteriaceae archaeon]
MKILLVLVVASLFLPTGLAHSGEDGAASPPQETTTSRGTLFDTFVPVTAVALALLLLVSVIAVALKSRLDERGKKLLMTAFLLIIIIPTAYMFLGTIYINMTSFTGGEVHWHADFTIYVNGEERQLRPPTGTLSNKVGTAKFHTHNDNRLHLEGVFKEREDATFHAFFDAVGGEYTQNRLAFPSANGWVNVS